jgi:DNA-binding MarR family transcriptional regulator
VTLNIDATAATAATPGGEHGALVADVVSELTSWNPREFITAFQRWHQGQISLIQLNVLTLLEATGPLPMSRLAEALDISVASLTGIIDRMEARSLVKRKRDAQDRRVVNVAPAAGGRKLFAQIDRRRRVGLAKLLVTLADEELRGLLVGHRALRAARGRLAAGTAAAAGALGKPATR